MEHLVTLAKQWEVAAAGMVEFGEIDEVALEVARQRGADLIISGYHTERSIMEKLLFQAIPTVNLIGQAHCPVMVVR